MQTADWVVGAAVVGRYALEAKLGEGSFGEVWRARDVSLGRDVALKVMRAQVANHEHLRRRFEREAPVLAQLKHTNVLQVFDRGEWRGRPFVVLEYVQGATLREWLEQHRARAQWPGRDEVRSLMLQICAGVGAAHRAGIVHRDLKPENVLLEVDEEGRTQAKVLDFGLARVGSGGSSVSLTVGTYAYMSPEQASEGSERVGPASDVFALAVMLVELLTGRLLPDDDSRAPWERHVYAGKGAALLQRVAALRPDVGRSVWGVLERALAPQPSDRPANATDLRRALDGDWGAHGAAAPQGHGRGAPMPPVASVFQPESMAAPTGGRRHDGPPPPISPEPRASAPAQGAMHSVFAPESMVYGRPPARAEASTAPSPRVAGVEPLGPAVMPASGFGAASNGTPTWELPPVRRVGDRMVLRRGATPPARCMVCGADDRVHVEGRGFSRYRGGAIAVGLCFWITVVASAAHAVGGAFASLALAGGLFVSRERAMVITSICDRHTRRDFAFAATGVLAALGGAVMHVIGLAAVVGSIPEYGEGRVFAGLGGVLVFAGIAASAMRAPLDLAAADAREVSLRGVNADALALLPETAS